MRKAFGVPREGRLLGTPINNVIFLLKLDLKVREVYNTRRGPFRGCKSLFLHDWPNGGFPGRWPLPWRRAASMWSNYACVDTRYLNARFLLASLSSAEGLPSELGPVGIQSISRACVCAYVTKRTTTPILIKTYPCLQRFKYGGCVNWVGKQDHRHYIHAYWLINDAVSVTLYGTEYEFLMFV